MKRYVTWEEVDTFVDELVEKFRDDRSITGVYGLPRGGLVMAVMLSNRLNIPMLISPSKGCIIVDDICDSGESLMHYVFNSSGEVTNDYIIATLFYKKNKYNILPAYAGYEKGNDWIVFPWEEKEE